MNAKELQRALWNEARGICEYCRLGSGEWTQDHIVPKKAAGIDGRSNLAVACPPCNLNKSSHLTATDPVTGNVVPLFSPRRDIWEQHFRRLWLHGGGAPIGKTAKGRATAALIFRWTSQRQAPELRWDLIGPLASYDVYRYLNNLRFLRLSGQFEVLDIDMTYGGDWFRDVSDPRLMAIGRFAVAHTRIEGLFTSSKRSEVEEGLRVVAHWLRAEGDITSQQRSWLLSARSILLQQLATLLMLSGRRNRAIDVQLDAARTHVESRAYSSDWTYDFELRQRSMAAKYADPEDAVLTKESVNIAEEATKTGDFRPVVYLADCLLVGAQHHGWRIAERVRSILDRAMRDCGYGQHFDLAHGAVIRRRWWLAKLVVGEHCDLDLFTRDIHLWQGWGLTNELREIAVRLELAGEAQTRAERGDMLHIVREALSQDG